MTSTIATRESRRRTAWAGLWLAGGLLLGGLTYTGLPLLGVGLYTTAAVLAIGMWLRYPGRLFDERDATIHRQASGHTLTLIAIISAVVFPLLTGLYGVGLFEWGQWTTASAFLAGGIFLIYATLTVVLSHNR